MLYNFSDPSIFLFIAASVADAAAVKSNIPSGLITDFNKGSPDFAFLLIVLLTIKYQLMCG